MRGTLCSCLAIAAVVLNPLGRAQERSGITVPAPLARWLSADYREGERHTERLQQELRAVVAAPSSERGLRIGWKIFGYGREALAPQWVEIDLGQSQPIDAVVLLPVDAPTADITEPGIGFPRRFRVELLDGPALRAVLADYTATEFPNPGALPVYLAAGGRTGRRVRITLLQPWTRNQYQTYALSEVMVLRGHRNLATGLRGVRVRTSDSLESPPVWSRDNLIDGQSPVGAPLCKSDRPLAHGWESARFRQAAASTWVQVDLGAAQAFDEIRLLPARLPEYSGNHGYGFPGRLRVDVATQEDFGDARRLADWTTLSLGDRAFSPLTVPGDRGIARYVRITASELWPRSHEHFLFALAELQVYRGDRNIALGTAVTAALASTDSSQHFRPEFLTDGLRGTFRIIEWSDWLSGLSHRREMQQALDRLAARRLALQPLLRYRLLGIGAGGGTLLLVALLFSRYRARQEQARAVAAVQRQIAGDLHDEIGSNLASIAMLTELSQRQKVELSAEDLADINRLASESSAAMRDLVWLIQPGPHDAARLADRLRAAAQRLLVGQEWTFAIEGLVVAPPLEVQRHLLLALKEMLHNVRRHAAARQVKIVLRVTEQQFTLSVQDDGRGFDPAPLSDGHGFTSLRHRAALLQGQLTCTSQPGNGAQITLQGKLRPEAPGGRGPNPATTAHDT